MLPRHPAMILFDVDGTLVDSVPDLAWCVDRMMERLGLPPRGERQVRNWVGNGVEALVRRALTGHMDHGPDPELYARAYPLFLELYADNTSKRSYLYPGVAETLRHLKRAGYPLGSVTNKAQQFTIPLLEQLGIRNCFEIVISGDSLPRKKPDPLPLLHAAEFFHVAPQDALMVGDSVSDVRAARAAGFAIFCMSYGYNHGEDIRDAQPDAVLECMTELPGLLPRRRSVAS